MGGGGGREEGGDNGTRPRGNCMVEHYLLTGPWKWNGNLNSLHFQNVFKSCMWSLKGRSCKTTEVIQATMGMASIMSSSNGHITKTKVFFSNAACQTNKAWSGRIKCTSQYKGQNKPIPEWFLPLCKVGYGENWCTNSFTLWGNCSWSTKYKQTDSHSQKESLW